MTYVDPGPRDVIQEVRQASGQTIVCDAAVNGALATVAGTPTWEAFVNGATVAIQSGTAPAASSVMTATLDASDASVWVLNQLYRMVFTFVAGGKTYTRERVFTVARVPVSDACPVVLNDLLGFHGGFDAAITQQSTASTGHARWIRPAWEMVRAELMAAGINVAAVNAMSLYHVTRYQALVFLALSLRKQAGDIYDKQKEDAEALFKRTWNALVLLHKPNDSTQVTADRTTAQQPDFRTGPDHAMGNLPFPYQGGRGDPFGSIR